MKCNICYFHNDEDKCDLHKNVGLSFFCTTKVRKIKGIETTDKYVDIVYGRKHNLRVLAVSMFSLIVSALILILKITEA